MPIVGFEFTKLIGEKKENITGKVNINNNVKITEVERADLPLGKGKQDGLKFAFAFTCKYTPDIGNVFFEGNVIYIGESKEVEKILKEWKTDKRLSKEIAAMMMNTILTRCNIEALMITRDVNLPPQIPLPHVEEGKKDSKDDYIG